MTQPINLVENMENPVVVLVRPRVMRNQTTGTYAAEILELGLGVYGPSREEVLDRLEKMFVSAVAARRRLGKLAAWLDNSGLEWYIQGSRHDKGAAVKDRANAEQVIVGDWHQDGVEAPRQLIA